MSARQVLILPALLALTLTACPIAVTGSLTVTVNAPAGAQPVVVITGPNGYSTTVSASTTISQLVVGTYTVKAPLTRTTDPIVSNSFEGMVSSGSVTVSENATATTTAIFAQRGGSGKLWAASFGTPTGVLSGYDANAFGSSGAVSATTSLAFDEPIAIAFDGSGNLWVGDLPQQTISRFTPAQLTQNPTPAPSIVLTSPANTNATFGTPYALAFDASGNLWIADSKNSKLVRFAPNQLIASGSPVPSIILSSITLDGLKTIAAPVALAFDAAGNLWVSNANAASLVKFSAASLSISGSPAPLAQIKNDTSDGGETLTGASGLAIDSTGNVWTANYSPNSKLNSISKFNVATLSGSSVVTPSVKLTLPNGPMLNQFQIPQALAFDNSGALWVTINTASGTTSSIVKFATPSALTSGAATPSATYRVNTPIAYSMAFSPVPSNLPLIQQK